MNGTTQSSNGAVSSNSSETRAAAGHSSSYCVLWNNYHGALVSTLGMLRREGQLLDCTLACTDGGRIHAHQLILAACSTVCRDFVKDTRDKHPVILLPSEVGVQELKAMVEFMYTGQVCIEQDRLKAFIQGARYLRIKGLEDNSEDTDNEDTELSGREELPSDPFPGRAKEDSSLAESRDKWQMVERKPIILPHASNSSNSRKRRRLSSSRRRPMHISNSVVCYEQNSGHDRDNASSQQHGNQQQNFQSSHSCVSSKQSGEKSDSMEPINKIRRMSSMVGHTHDDLEICTCSSRKTWSVADTEALLKVWRETLTQVPPSYFIRSMSLCKRVARNLQARGVQKNWRQCQVKMKNLRREVRLFKESRCRLSTRKPSEVANACQKLLPIIEEIFNREEEIRQEWYQLKTDDRHREDGVDDLPHDGHERDILAQVAVLADSDIGEEDTDGACVDEAEVEGPSAYEGGRGGSMMRVGGMGVEDMVEVASTSTYEGTRDVPPHHSIHHQPDGTIHHIVEDVSLRFTKEEPETSHDEL